MFGLKSIVVCLTSLLGAALACGAEPQTAVDKSYLESAADNPAGLTTPKHPVAPGEGAPEWEKPLPISFLVSYTLVSDYVFRGVNFSEFDGEGREKPNHQVCLGAEYDAGGFGTFGGTVWLEWFAGQEALTPQDEGNLQEVDYTLFWRKPVEALATTFETGWIAYTFPRASGDAYSSYEWYFKLSLDDRGLFGTDGAVLNPYFAYYLDYDLADGASWLELGVSHDFELSSMGMGQAPLLKNVTLTPSLVLGVDHRYYDSLGLGADSSVGTRLGNLNYGLAASYDLSEAIGMPERYGSISLDVFINYSQALHDESPLVNDELFGGVSVAYSW